MTTGIEFHSDRYQVGFILNDIAAFIYQNFIHIELAGVFEIDCFFTAQFIPGSQRKSKDFIAVVDAIPYQVKVYPGR